MIRKYLSGVSEVLAQMPIEQIEVAAEILRTAWRDGNQIFVIGNGGSAATASHFACDLQKGLASRWPGCAALCVSDNAPLLTAWANDHGREQMFSMPIVTLRTVGDVLVAISTSGNSPSVLRAVQDMQDWEYGQVIALTGDPGGELAGIVRCLVAVTSSDTQVIEDCHLAICHAWYRYLLEKGP
mgnify:CR=1 FL=1